MDENRWRKVEQYLQSNDVDGAATYLEARLLDAPTDRFRSIVDSHFTNSPREVLTHINKFVAACESQFEVRAIYLEMNGFDINYDRWYFDVFAYTRYGDDPKDLEWLAYWNSPYWEPLTLHGLERAQEAFRWYHENEVYELETHDAEKEVATLLVMVRFVQLVSQSRSSGTLRCNVPLLATAHGFDIVGRFVPKRRDT